MLSILSNTVTKLENAVTSAKTALDKVAAQREAAVAHAKQLGDQASDALPTVLQMPKTSNSRRLRRN